jgi:hypothetical protein
MKLGSSEVNRLRERVETFGTRGLGRLQGDDKMGNNRWVEALGPDCMEVLIGGLGSFCLSRAGKGGAGKRGRGREWRGEWDSCLDPLRSRERG